MERTGQSDPRGILEGHAPSEQYDVPDAERKLAAELMSRFEEAQRTRNYWEQDANFYRHFLVGNQLVLRSQQTNEVLRIAVVGEQSRRLHSIDNKLRPTARALLGKMTRIIPSVQVMPATTDQAEMRSAIVADSFLDYTTSRLKLRTKYLGACRYLTWAGTAFIQSCWNKNSGRLITWCRKCNYTGQEDDAGSPCPQCAMEEENIADQKNQQLIQQDMELGERAAAAGISPENVPSPEMVNPATAPQLELVREGDIDVILHDPRDIYPEPGITDLKQARWICVRKAVPVSRLRGDYPEFARFISDEGGLYTDRSIGYYGSAYNSKTEVQDLNDHAWMYEFHERPTSKYPKGRLIKMVNNIIVEHADNPGHMCDRLNFYLFRFEVNDGEFWGESFIAQAWHLQKERNKLLTQLRTHRELTNNPQRLVPMQSRISQAEWDEQPGRVISYNPIGGAPRYLELPQFPAYVYQETERMRMAIQEKAGVTDQEMGFGTGDVSGRYAAIQEAQASESLAPIIVENNEEWTEMHRSLLQFAQKYYSEDRFWTVTGRDRMMTFSFKDMNLSPGWDVYLSEEDSLSRNPALRRQDAERLLQLGVFTDPTTGVPDMRAFKRAAGLKLPGVGPDLDGGERSYAAEIPNLLKRGKQFVPRPWDDAQIIVEELTGWLRAARHNEDEELIQQVEQIWSIYMTELIESQRLDPSLTPSNAQMPQQQQAGGAPGNEPPGAMAVGGVSKPGNVASDAEGITQGADRAAEQAARSGMPHES